MRFYRIWGGQSIARVEMKIEPTSNYTALYQNCQVNCSYKSLSYLWASKEQTPLPKHIPCSKPTVAVTD